MKAAQIALLAKNAEGKPTFKILAGKDGKIEITAAKDNDLGIASFTIDRPKGLTSATIGSTVTIINTETMDFGFTKAAATGSQKRKSTPSNRETMMG